MGTAVPYHSASAPPLANQIHHLQNKFGIPIPTHVPFVMRLRPDLTLKRVAKNISFNERFQDSRVFCLKHMETNANQVSIKQEKEEPKQESKELPQQQQPPPPEKPEPGDCCGSGCVRCVWDVYYEELEAYDKLYKTDSTNTKSN
ncbi:hypothetical protein Pint_28357 [Pistacia integerrima]|uniref:Uncharacterized protein n=1 Tax=Pistacia integerrima TaxID=434235 RepID=A0ACC0YPJ5_9ROSI|nr:hypothetical protein Pint_28357 [Pistacia integerrima]